MTVFLDTETCGFVGPVVLIQYQFQSLSTDEPIVIHDVWHEPVKSTLLLIERIVSDDVVLFNAVFDWFHLVKLYNIFSRVPNKNLLPKIEEVALLNSLAVGYNHSFLRPRSILDLMLVIRKTKWQTLMDRDDVTIRRVPYEVAETVANELQNRLELPGIFFAKRTQGYQWEVGECDERGLCEIKLRFGASYGLKPLASEILKVRDTVDYPIPKDIMPEEYAYNPYNTAWKKVIQKHIDWWRYNKTARTYAENDIVYLRRLYEYWQKPYADDTDSTLTIAVANSRWAGFSIDRGRMSDRFIQNAEFLRDVPVNYTSPHDVKRYLLDKAPRNIHELIGGTDKNTLKALSKLRPVYPEVAAAADTVSRARKLDKENTILKQLLDTGRFCPELKIIGTRSGRMSGGGEDEGISSLNPQGIQRSKEIRELFTLKDNDETLSGGDFVSQEVTIVAAWCKDETLNAELKQGKSFHALLGEALFNVSYDDVLASKGLMDSDIYSPSKSTAFALFYGAQVPKLARTAGIPEEQMEMGYAEFINKYPKVGVSRATIYDAFCSMRQPGGIGTRIIWREPADYIESLLGFRRYFTLENAIVKTIFNLAENLPNSVTGDRLVERNRRTQTVRGATQSALFGVAFQIQAANMRAAANHVIQSTGGEITKRVQCDIWNLQPKGIHESRVKLFNVHDEIECVHEVGLEEIVAKIVNESVEQFREVVPLIQMDWKKCMSNWGDK